jgi:hypothetical protein
VANSIQGILLQEDDTESCVISENHANVPRSPIEPSLR